MLNLDPTKLLIIAVVAVILLGPDKLPQVGRQAGAAWRTFNDFRHRMETEVRSSIPDLPSSADIARMARSPSALLNHLSTLSPDESANGNVAAGAADAAAADGATAANGAEGNGAAAANGAAANGAAGSGADGASANGTAGEASVNGNGNGNGTAREASVSGVGGADVSGESARTSDNPSGAESHSEQSATQAPAMTPTMPTAPMPPMPPQPSTPPTATPPATATPPGSTLPGPGAVGDPTLN